jgi:hypothetical protein
LFENACRAATHAQGEEKEKKVFLEWLPLKLDTAALQLYNYKKELTYPEIKKELSELFTDPHKAYRWKSDPKAYQWDGKESLNAVAAKVIRKVKKNERSLMGSAQDESCFVRFRMAMPAKFRKSIDLGTAKELEMESRPPKGQCYQQRDTPPRRMTQSPKGQRSCRSTTPLWLRTLCHMRN